MTAAGPRVYYAMARDAMAPSIFGHLHHRKGAPVFALLVQAFIASMFRAHRSLRHIAYYAGSALSLFAGRAVASVYVARARVSIMSAHTFACPGYPVTPGDLYRDGRRRIL